MSPIMVVAGLLFVPLVAVLGAAIGLNIGYAIYSDKYSNFKEFVKDTFFKKEKK